MIEACFVIGYLTITPGFRLKVMHPFSLGTRLGDLSINLFILIGCYLRGVGEYLIFTLRAKLGGVIFVGVSPRL